MGSATVASARERDAADTAAVDTAATAGAGAGAAVDSDAGSSHFPGTVPPVALTAVDVDEFEGPEKVGGAGVRVA